MKPRFDFARLKLFAAFSGIWLGFAVIYLSLRTNQYTDVDGALRCLTIYWRRPPYVGPNNHLLYPANVYAWTRLLKALGFSWSGPESFIRSVQAMNAIFAAGAVALVYLLIRRLTGAGLIAIVCTLIYGTSRAVLIHATNSAEPVVGLFVSLVAAALAIEGLVRAKLSLLVFSGAGLALALANYESMFLIAPLGFVLSMIWPERSKTRGEINFDELRIPSRFNDFARRSIRGFAMGAGILIGVVAIYGSAYRAIGVTTPGQMLRRFTQMGGSPKVYGGFSLSKAVNFIVGLTGNVVAVLPPDYQGLRRLLLQDGNLTRISLMTSVGVIIFAIVVVGSLQLVPRRGRPGPSRSALTLLVGAFFCAFLPVFYWDPIYDKLWLQPLALATIVAGLASSRANGASVRIFALLAGALLIFEIIVNIPLILRGHARKTECLDDARAVAGIVRPGDKVIADFDPVSTLWAGLYNENPSRVLVFPAVRPSESISTVARWEMRCAIVGCRLLFINLLDQTEQGWQAFLGSRVGVPYQALSNYRDDSKTLLQFTCEQGSLREFLPKSSGRTSPPVNKSPARALVNK